MIMKQFRAARRVSTPLIAITTPDPAATLLAISQTIKPETALLGWDTVRGLKPLNEPGQNAFDQICRPISASGNTPETATTNLTEMLSYLAEAPEDSIICLHAMHRYMGPEYSSAIQAIWNLRDAFKSNMRTLVLLCPYIDLPADLASDVLVLDEELPTPDELKAIVKQSCDDAKVPVPSEEELTRAVDALRGLAAFPAEQVTAMSMSKAGVDVAALWERKRRTIEQTRGLGVDREKVTFDAIGGMKAAKEFGRRIINGGCKPRVFVRIDEIEKMLAGAGANGAGDSSGVSQDQLGVILREMEDQNWTGLIAVGPPGSGKSVFSKAMGGEAGVPTLMLDLGAAKGSLVGDSEAAIRQVMKVIRAVADDGAFFIATCNRLEALPPELRRRFRLGIWYFDLPTADERESIWQVCLRRYGLAASAARPDDSGWTGAEIRNACDLAWRLNISPKEAGAYVVPVSVADPDGLERLRKMANGKFLSANEPGVYKYQQQVVGIGVAKPASGSRISAREN